MRKKNAVASIGVSILVIWAISLIKIGISTAWYEISANSDDGTEVNKSCWYENGLPPPRNYLGRYLSDETYDGGFRFHVENLTQGEEITYARLRFASHGSDIASTVKLLFEGVLQESPTTFSQDERPSQKTPKTNTIINWEINDSWIEGTDGMPLYYSSPNIAPIINEILALPGWGTGTEGKKLIITINDNGSNPDEINRVFFEDFWNEPDAISTPTILEIYKTAYDTFLGKEFLGRITDMSVTVNLYSLVETDTYIEYGTTPGIYTDTSPEHLNQPAEQVIEIILDNLTPDIQFYYRLAYKKTDEENYEYGQEHTFHTQRLRGSSFVFAINADEHLLPKNTKNLQLYGQTLQNVRESNPDFFISLGDFAHPEFYMGRNAANLQEAIERYLLQREYLDNIAHSIPFYLVIGNHEGEEGWHYDFENPGQNDDSLAVIATKARKEIMPNPYPDEFYSGNTDIVPEYSLREDYFAWEWGDALFVVLDPFWYTKRKPHNRSGPGPEPGSGDGWDWTLGKEQYDWLYETSHNSDAQWKFVFIHHLTSSTNELFGLWNFYGRGGIEVAKYKVDGRASYEWGGEDETGTYIFDIKRPNWTHGPIHDMLVAENVNIVFHGHDHFFAKQDLDGIVYQECPQPSNSNYNYGFKAGGRYQYGDFLPNSGHLQVTVNPHSVKVDYVRSYLPGDGENGIIAHSYSISDLSLSPDTLNFGQVIVGTEASDTLYVSNEGTDTLQVTDLICDSLVFQVEDNTPFFLAPSETEPVEVTFAPDAAQPEEATVYVFTDVGEDSVKLLGEGVPLAAIQDLVALLLKPNLYLEWEPISGATYYKVHRNTYPNFEPSPDDTLATTIEAQYLDTGAVGNPAVSYYYLVFAANDLTQSPPSNRVGEFDKNMIDDAPLGLRKPLSTKDH